MKQRSFFTLIFLSFILLSQGQSFGELHTITSGILPSTVGDIQTADTDNDGDLDILAISSGSRKIYFLENIGNGEYAVLQELDMVFEDLNTINVSDINMDGLIDIVYSCFDYSDQLAWIKNIGNNKFVHGSAIFSIEGTGWTSVPYRVCEINGDGFDDVVIAVNEYDYSLEVILNKGDGTFEHSISLIEDGSVGFFDCTDIDGDGDIDVIYEKDGDYVVSVSFNDGNGNFVNEEIANQDSQYKIASFYSFDSDNDLDLDIMAWTKQDSIVLFINDGNQIFDESLTIKDSLFLFHSNKVTSFDYDKDGDIDLINQKLQILKNQGNNLFKLFNNKGFPFSIAEIEVADINGNGNEEVVYGLWSKGAIGFIENITVPNNYITLTSEIFGVNLIGYQKINNDDYPDICILNKYNKNIFYLNNGNGEFYDTITTPILHREFAGSAFDDFNNDGYGDIVSFSDYESSYSNDSSNLKFARNNGDNTFTTIYDNRFNNLSKNYYPYFIDFNGDSRTDLLMINSYGQPDTIMIFNINSDFTLSCYDTVILNQGVGINHLKFYDLNYDGQNDMLISNGNTLMVNYQFNGHYGNTMDTIISLPTLISGFVVGNINEDTTHDMVISRADHIVVLENIIGNIYEQSFDLNIPEYTYQLYSKDINNNNLHEVFCISSNKISILTSIRYNTFTLETHYYESGQNHVHLKTPFIFYDIDIDGDYDFLCSYNDNADISWLENNFIHASVKENETNNKLLVYPNPAGESINIKLEEAAATDYEILLYNNLGMEINRFQAEANQTQMSINTKELKPGIYYVVLKSENNISTSKVLIVR